MEGDPITPTDRIGAWQPPPERDRETRKREERKKRKRPKSAPPAKEETDPDSEDGDDAGPHVDIRV